MAPNHPPAQPQTQPPAPFPSRRSAPEQAPCGEGLPGLPPVGRRTGPVHQTAPGVVQPLARGPVRTDPRASRGPDATVPRHRPPASHRLRPRRLVVVPDRERPADHPARRRDPAARDGTAARQGGSRGAHPGAGADARAAKRSPDGTSAEWVCELADVGRVRCVSFRDQRGPGAVFRLIPTRLISADQLGLSRDIQALCSEREGLILVAGPRHERQVDPDLRLRRSHQPDAGPTTSSASSPRSSSSTRTAGRW